jgi:hypothetical protein
MNKRQFISKLQKELNALFNPEIKVTITQKDNTIELGFWRDLEVLAIYTIHNIQYNEEYLHNLIKKVEIMQQGYILGRILERKIMLEELSQIQNDEDVKE